MNKDLILVFPTPIWSSIINESEDINNIMYDYIKKLNKIDPDGLKKSNFLGWHSKDFNLEDNEPRKFLQAIKSNLNQSILDMGWDTNKNEIKITSMWSIINSNKASNHRHIHANNYISAAYYVKAPKDCGDIMFYDPRDSKVIRKPIMAKPNQLNSEVINITPKEGLLVLFPSYLHHSVNINQSQKERIVISFNIDLRSK